MAQEGTQKVNIAPKFWKKMSHDTFAKSLPPPCVIWWNYLDTPHPPRMSRIQGRTKDGASRAAAWDAKHKGAPNLSSFQK